MGGGATIKTYRMEETSRAGFAVEWSERRRGAGFILFPVVGNGVTRQKSRRTRVQGWRFAPANTTRPLSGWIGGAAIGATNLTLTLERKID